MFLPLINGTNCPCAEPEIWKSNENVILDDQLQGKLKSQCNVWELCYEQKMPILTKVLTIYSDMLYVMKWDEPEVYPFWILQSEEMSLIDTESLQTRIGVGRPSFWISNNGLKLCQQSVLCTRLWKWIEDNYIRFFRVLLSFLIIHIRLTYKFMKWSSYWCLYTFNKMKFSSSSLRSSEILECSINTWLAIFEMHCWCVNKTLQPKLSLLCTFSKIFRIQYQYIFRFCLSFLYN